MIEKSFEQASGILETERLAENGLAEAAEFAASAGELREGIDRLEDGKLWERLAEESGLPLFRVKEEAAKTGFDKIAAGVSEKAGKLRKRLGAAVLAGVMLFGATLAEAAENRLPEPTPEEDAAVSGIYVKSRAGGVREMEQQLGKEFKDLSYFALREWMFAFVREGSGNLRLVRHMEGGSTKATFTYDFSAEKVDADTGRREEILVHNHPLEDIKEVKWADRGVRIAPEVLDAEIQAMREGRLEPIPMPPSRGDIFGLFGGAIAAVSLDQYRVVGEVADAGGMWRFTLDEPAAKSGQSWNLLTISRALRDKRMAPPIQAQLRERMDKYDELLVHIVQPYSERAIADHQKGNDSLLEKEIAEKKTYIRKLVSALREIGVILEYRPYA